MGLLPNNGMYLLAESKSAAVGRVEKVSTTDGSGSTMLTPEGVSRTREGEPRRLRRRLAGDLDNIVLTALRKEPQRRYSSAQQLSEDIGSHLDGLPVRARKDIFSYRTGKFVRRNKLGVGAAAAFLLLIAVARTLEQMGLARTRTADYTGAEVNYAEALAIWRSLYGDRHERVAALLEKFGRASIERNDWEAAADYFREMLAVARLLYGEQYELATCHDSDRGAPCTERALSYLALSLQKQGDLAAAEKFHRQAVEVARRTNPNDDDVVDHRQHNLADFIGETRGDFGEAERLHREALDKRLRLYGEKYIGVGYSRSALAVALEANKKYAEAEFNLRENSKIYEEIFGREHPRTLWCYSNLGHFLNCKTDRGEAAGWL